MHNSMHATHKPKPKHTHTDTVTHVNHGGLDEVFALFSVFISKSIIIINRKNSHKILCGVCLVMLVQFAAQFIVQNENIKSTKYVSAATWQRVRENVYEP